MLQRGLAAAAFLMWASAAAGQDRPAAEAEMRKAVEEFRIITRELGLREDDARKKKAQNGTAAPAWHGRVFENFRNDFLDAVPHEVTQNGARKSMLRRNQFGFNVAGPFLIPHLYPRARGTYFSVSYEGVRENVARSFLRTVPTMPERAGDFSATVDQAGNPLPIYDLKTTHPNPQFDPSQPVSPANLQYQRDPFPSNRIPAARLSAVAQKALVLYPAPNASIGPFFRNNFFIHSPERNNANGMIGKLDQTLRERHRFSLELSHSNGLVSSAKWFDNGANPGPADRDFQSRRGGLEYVFTISSQTLNTFGFEASSNGSRSGRGDSIDYPASIGLGGLPGRDFPLFYFSDYVGMGQAYPDSKNVRNRFVWTDSFSTRRGKHNWRAAAQLARYQVNTFWPAYPAGSFAFSSGLTSLPGVINTGHDFASFLLGLPDFARVSDVRSPSYFRNGAAVLSLRHTYEATRALTLSWGLRLHTTTGRTEKYGRQSTVNLQALNPACQCSGALVTAGHNGYGAAFKPTLTKLEPSASLAWTPRTDARMVIRAAFARSYEGTPVYFGQWGTQGFNGSPAFVSPNVQLEPALALAGGVPAPKQRLPDLRPEAVNDTIADLLDSSDRQPTYQSASLSLEREIPGAVVLTLGATYSGGKNLYVGDGAANPNAVSLDALRYRDQLNNETFFQSLRPYPQYKGFDVYSSWPLGRYERDAGFVRLEKRASAGLMLSAYYEFSKQLDDYSGPYGTQDFFNRHNEWSLTAGHNPQQLSFSYVYELPLGPNKAFLNYDDWRRYLVDGWSFSGMTTFYAGDPIALRPAFNNTGGVVQALSVNVVPRIDQHVPDPGPELWFNPAAFEQPADFSIGNASRTSPTLRNPSTQNHDLSVTKRFGLAAERSVEISAMGLNFLNHANWNDPDPVIGPESAPNINAGKIIGSRGGRIIQMSLRFSF